MFNTKEVQFAEKPLLKPVFFGSAIFIISFVLLSLIFKKEMSTGLQNTLSFIGSSFGWFYLLSVSLFVTLCFILIVSPLGNIRLGPEGSSPDFSYGSWVAMLFSAGMGIGLLYFGVAEPLSHFVSPPSPSIEPQSVEAAQSALKYTFFHWGISAWAIYAIVGLGLAYFAYRHNLPLTVRSALYPLIGDRIYGWPGHIVDIIAVLGTMFGVATSLGFGVMQVNAGLNHLFGLPQSTFYQVIGIIVITGLATISVVSGLDAGIKRLSELNLGAASLLLIATLILGPTLFLLRTFVENIGTYIDGFVSMTFNMYAYESALEDQAAQKWLQAWTIFYWGWWISWSPFVGMFIARISRGRTIRQFVVGVLFVPATFTFLWMTVFGDTAILLQIKEQVFDLTNGVNSNLALFEMFEALPFGFILSCLSVILIVTFFVTSSDLGSLVIDTLTAGGREDSPVWQRVFWAVSEGVVAIVLLTIGGQSALGALQAASITAALPFTVVMVFFCIGIAKALQNEAFKSLSASRKSNVAHAHLPWKQRLKSIVSWPKSQQMHAYIESTVRPAMEQVRKELMQHTDDMTLDVQMDVNIHHTENGGIELVLTHGDETDFVYSVQLVQYAIPTFAYMERNKKNQELKERKYYYRLEPHTLEGSQHYDIYGFTTEQVIQDILHLYEDHLVYLQLVRE